MKTLLLIITTVIAATSTSIENVRDMYVKSVDDEGTAEKLYRLLQNTTDPTLKGYKGAVKTILAKHYYNPFSKWAYFQEGAKELDVAINEHPTDPELRFLRFSIQTNAPAFLGYTGNIYNDKDVIISNLAELKFDNNNEMRQLIVDYMLSTTYCSITEKQKIKATLALK